MTEMTEPQTTALALLPSLASAVESLGVGEFLPREALERGLLQMQATLARVAVEALDAEAQRRSLAEAAEDDVGYPTLHRLHVGVRDILTMSLPEGLRAWAEQVLAMPEWAFGDDLQRGLGRLAADADASPALRALARVLLYQAVRVNLLVAEHLSGTSIAAVGAQPADVDRIAEGEVAHWIREAERIPGDVRPLEVLVAAALAHLEEHVAELGAVLARLDDDLATAFRLRAELELKLRDMEAADAVLIRNAFAPALDEQRVEVERLREHHRLVLGERSRDALDQQVSRLRGKMKRGEWPHRRDAALIDLIADSEDQGDE
jgi:hypothetical protein